MKKFGHVTILVKDYEEALDFYVNKMGFVKKSDNSFGDGNRWLTVSPSDQADLEIVFVMADTPEKQERVGSQVADHVLLTLQTNDCIGDYEKMRKKGVRFLGKPKQQFYGLEVVFEDLYGNRFDLIELSQ